MKCDGPVGIPGQNRYSSQVENVPIVTAIQDPMSTEDNTRSTPVQLTEDDVAYLLSMLRDPSQTQPITTQQMIDALRLRALQ